MFRRAHRSARASAVDRSPRRIRPEGVDDPDGIVRFVSGRWPVSSWSSCRRSVAFVTLLVLAGGGMAPFLAIYARVLGLVALRCDGCTDGLGTCRCRRWSLSMWRALLRDMLPGGAAIAIDATAVVVIRNASPGHRHGGQGISRSRPRCRAVLPSRRLDLRERFGFAGARSRRPGRSGSPEVRSGANAACCRSSSGFGVSALDALSVQSSRSECSRGRSSKTRLRCFRSWLRRWPWAMQVAVWSLTLVALGRARRVLARRCCGA